MFQMSLYTECNSVLSYDRHAYRFIIKEVPYLGNGTENGHFYKHYIL
jgi:hypothetical protein